MSSMTAPTLSKTRARNAPPGGHPLASDVFAKPSHSGFTPDRLLLARRGLT
jgi:hypothetical protein